MEPTFKTKALQKLATDERVAKRELGEPCAKQLRNRLADLRAAKVVGELLAGQPHPLKGDRVGQFAVTLHGGVRLVFEATDEPLPTTPEGDINWPAVANVRVIFIGDYHE